MNVRTGHLIPRLAYAKVQDVFRLFYAANGDANLIAKYYVARDALGLTVLDDNDVPQTAVVHIVDCTADDPAEPLAVTLLPK